MRLYLVRHAESEANILKILNSALPGPPLTELGHSQASGLAERLSGEPIAAVYASRATRAQQTAAPLATSLAMSVQVIDGIQEVFVGDLEDRGDQEALMSYFTTAKAWASGDLSTGMPGGETGEQVRTRFLSAIGGLRAKHADVDADKAIVVVSHGGAIRLGAEWLADNVGQELAGKELLGNTAMVRFESLADGRWRCLDWAGSPLGG
ncbi:histidine phosphatase family protein [Saccharomonospora sp. NPDC006951]